MGCEKRKYVADVLIDKKDGDLKWKDAYGDLGQKLIVKQK